MRTDDVTRRQPESPPGTASSHAPVLQLVTGLNVGGAERMVLNIAREMQRRGEPVIVVSLIDGRELLDLMPVDDLDIRFLGMDRTAGSFARTIARLGDLVRREHIGIIHAHLPHAGMVAMAVRAWTPEVRVVFTSHSFGGFSGFRTTLFRATRGLRATDVLLGEGQHPRMNARRSVTIPNGIEPRSDVLAPADLVAQLATDDASRQSAAAGGQRPFTFAGIGSFNAHKNPLGLIEAFVKLLGAQTSASPPLRLVMAGAGPQLDDARALIGRHGLEGRVHLLGMRPDVVPVLSCCDALVIPSHYEGLPMVALEAGSLGLPVVCAPVGTMPALLGDDRGFLARSSGAEDLAAAMRLVLDDAPDSARRGMRLRSLVMQRYTLESCVDAHLRLYTQIRQE